MSVPVDGGGTTPSDQFIASAPATCHVIVCAVPPLTTSSVQEVVCVPGTFVKFAVNAPLAVCSNEEPSLRLYALVPVPDVAATFFSINFE